MKSGQVHDGRSPDYNDWTLNGDIVLWYPVLNCAVEQKKGYLTMKISFLYSLGMVLVCILFHILTIISVTIATSAAKIKLTKNRAECSSP